MRRLACTVLRIWSWESTACASIRGHHPAALHRRRSTRRWACCTCTRCPAPSCTEIWRVAPRRAAPPPRAAAPASVAAASGPPAEVTLRPLRSRSCAAHPRLPCPARPAEVAQPAGGRVVPRAGRWRGHGALCVRLTNISLAWQPTRGRAAGLGAPAISTPRRRQPALRACRLARPRPLSYHPMPRPPNLPKLFLLTVNQTVQPAVLPAPAPTYPPTAPPRPPGHRLQPLQAHRGWHPEQQPGRHEPAVRRRPAPAAAGPPAPADVAASAGGGGSPCFSWGRAGCAPGANIALSPAHPPARPSQPAQLAGPRGDARGARDARVGCAGWVLQLHLRERRRCVRCGLPRVTLLHAAPAPLTCRRV